MGALIEELGPANLAAGAALLAGLVVLVLAVRAVTNAALALRARVFALGTGLGLTALGLGKPLGWDRRIPELLAGWLDTPLEQAAAVVAAVLAVAVVLAYFWIRAMMRLMWLAFAGACLLGTALAVGLAGQGFVAVPAWLAQTSVLAAIAGGLVLLLGTVRMLRPTAART